MKYVIVGAGGTGGSIAAYLGRKNKDVSLIARGQHLVNLKQQMFFQQDTNVEVFENIKAFSAEEYLLKGGRPDVIFICTKSYSLGGIADFIKEISGETTVVIPILNGIQASEKVKELIPEANVADGCMYIVAEKKSPGRIFMRGKMLRIIFGSGDEKVFELLTKVEADLKTTDIDVVLSKNIKRDIYRKFSLVSAMAAYGLYFDAPMGPAQTDGPERDFFKSLVEENLQLANKMGITFDIDLLAKNLEVLDHTSKLSTTSLQRDVKAGGLTEAESLILDPIKLGETHGLDMTSYRKVAEKMNIIV